MTKTIQEPTPTTISTARLSGEVMKSGKNAASRIGRFQRACQRSRAATCSGERAPDTKLGSCPAPLSLQSRYALSVAGFAVGSGLRRKSALRVQCGIHQFHRPSSFISDGTSSVRMTVASKMIPAARPIANTFTS